MYIYIFGSIIYMMIYYLMKMRIQYVVVDDDDDDDNNLLLYDVIVDRYIMTYIYIYYDNIIII